MDDPIRSDRPGWLPGIDGLAISAWLCILGVGAALAAGAILLTALMPAGSGHLYKAIGGYLLILLPLLAFLPAHRPNTRFGSANTVTLIRAAMVCLLASLYGEHWFDIGLLVTGIAILALSLDGVDGWLARLKGSQSRFGARFDMETDALLALALSALAWQSGTAGAWVMLAGLMRYGFIAATMVWHWMNRPLPESRRRKTLCVWQLIALIACVAPILPDGVRTAAAVAAVAMVAWSFAVDVDWLIRRRRLPLAA